MQIQSERIIEMNSLSTGKKMETVQNYPEYQSFFKRLGIADWIYAALLCLGSLFALTRFASHMDVYEHEHLGTCCSRICIFGMALEVDSLVNPCTCAVEFIRDLHVWWRVECW